MWVRFTSINTADQEFTIVIRKDDIILFEQVLWNENATSAQKKLKTRMLLDNNEMKNVYVKESIDQITKSFNGRAK